MKYFLTSSPFGVSSPYLNPANGFVERLARAVPSPCRLLFVCSDPDSHAFTDRIALDLKKAMEAEGFSVSSFQTLDGRTASRAGEWIAGADLIVLAGGHVPTQNAFFQKIRLKEKLEAFDGAILGISAGSMNSAEVVYAQPEREGEAISPHYRRFLPGLGLTKAMILPHYQLIKDDILDGLRLFEDITYPDSAGRVFYVLPDGSYLLGEGGRETLYGESWRVADGVMEKLCGEGEAFRL